MRINRTILKGALALLSAVAFLSGCYYDTEEHLYPGGTCNTTNVTYSGTIKQIIQVRCATPACHVPGSTGPSTDFTLDADVASDVADGSFRDRVFSSNASNRMPPTSAAALTSCELTQIKAWLDAGGPMN